MTDPADAGERHYLLDSLGYLILYTTEQRPAGDQGVGPKALSGGGGVQEETTGIGSSQTGPAGRAARGRMTWVVAAWAVVTIAVVAWVLPRGRESTASETPANDPAVVSTLVARGYAAMDQRESDPAALDRALAVFEQAHSLDPDHLDARFALAWARQVKGLPESEWRELYEATIREAALLTYLSHFNLGYAERQTGRYAEAVASLEQAVRAMPERADGWAELGRAHEAMGQREAAAEAFRRAAELQR